MITADTAYRQYRNMLHIADVLEELAAEEPTPFITEEFARQAHEQRNAASRLDAIYHFSMEVRAGGAPTPA